MRKYRLMVIKGDGIGPELIEAALEVLQAVEKSIGNFKFDIQFHEGGASLFKREGYAFSEKSLMQASEFDAILKGPVGDPDLRLTDGTEASSISGILRNGLDLYANIRPISLLPTIEGVNGRQFGDIDYVIVRENTEGLYASRGKGIGNDRVMNDILMLTRHGVERIARFAFNLAKERSLERSSKTATVTCVDKSNVLRTMAFFRKIVTEVSSEFPEITLNYIYSDACAQAMVLSPEQFDVLVMENFLGDLLSDLGGATVGGIGLCHSGNYGNTAAYFEPIHGTAPDIAGKNKANPLSQIRCLELIFEKLGESHAKARLYNAICSSLKSGQVTLDRNGCPSEGTINTTKSIIQCL
jgi:isocitrate/isopropylmalate dehydrogenase